MHGFRPASLSRSTFAAPGTRGLGINHLAAYSRAGWTSSPTASTPIERTCAECGATLTDEEIRASLEAGDTYLCSVHAAEQVPLEEEDELEAG